MGNDSSRFPLRVTSAPMSSEEKVAASVKDKRGLVAKFRLGVAKPNKSEK